MVSKKTLLCMGVTGAELIFLVGNAWFKAGGSEQIQMGVCLSTVALKGRSWLSVTGQATQGKHPAKAGSPKAHIGVGPGKSVDTAVTFPKWPAPTSHRKHSMRKEDDGSTGCHGVGPTSPATNFLLALRSLKSPYMDRQTHTERTGGRGAVTRVSLAFTSDKNRLLTLCRSPRSPMGAGALAPFWPGPGFPTD